MNDKKLVREEMEKIEIPKDLHMRSVLGVKKAKNELGNSRNQTKSPSKSKGLLLTAAAAIVITATAWSYGSTYIVDAGETLISKVFGSEENLKQAVPQMTKKGMKDLENHFELAQKTLSPEEFQTYSRLENEMLPFENKMRTKDGNRFIFDEKKLNDSERKRYKEIRIQISHLEKKIYAVTQYDFEGAKKIADYPVLLPTFIPDGYKIVSAKGSTKDESPNKDPFIKTQYMKGEFSIYVSQMPLSSKDLLPNAFWYEYKKSTPFELDGNIVHYNKDYNIQTMMVKVQDTADQKGYYLVLVGELITKDEMIKIMSSMLKQQ
ncbi:hypothetical protein [Falsibacillus albus]|uniref:DUF4367 domain-containing protein n=1 Tax=Falsibacillus albus TaxID=2478915 RepID=A0A3L7JU75_9BACI|nr:hypothetical protein [Falsibacillus albus]RLQ94286.1 hypothetical protein D9X91_14600 [Falsibacillus albus]